MILNINDNKTTLDLQEKFSECFPQLKIEFYTKAHGWKEASMPGDCVKGDVSIGALRKKHNQGLLEIKSFYQTGKVEADFENLFGLHVQIFRKQDGKWLQTKSTDGLTLHEQSKLEGKTIYQPYVNRPEEVYEDFNTYTI